MLSEDVMDLLARASGGNPVYVSGRRMLLESYAEGSEEFNRILNAVRRDLARNSAKEALQRVFDEGEHELAFEIFIEEYGARFVRYLSGLQGAQAERFRRALGVLTRDSRPSDVRSQNQNWQATPDQARFTYQDVAALAGVSVRQAKRVLINLYGTERKGSKRWFSRQQVEAAFPWALKTQGKN